MHDIRVIDIVPLHRMITLVVFEDTTIGEIDAKLLRNTHEELNPRLCRSSVPETRYLGKDTIDALTQEIDHSEFAESLGSEVITIEIEEPLYSNKYYGGNVK